MAKVRFVGGPTGVRRLKANVNAKPTEIGGTMELSKAAIRRMRGLGYQFEAVDDEPLPDPEPQEPPSNHQQQRQQNAGPDIEVARR
jgi:hypothetical protein